MAADRGIALDQVKGSGPAGRIVKADIEAFTPTPAARAPSAPVVTPDGATEVPLSQMRKTIARRLGEVWVETPHFFLTMDIDMAAAMAERKRLNAELAAAEAGVKLSVNDLILKACAIALQRNPAVNVSFAGDHLVQHSGSHVGVAVAVDGGLITPTVFDAHKKSIGAIATEVRELAGRARDKRLKPEEYTGGTFSVSNLGMYGIEHFTAIINPPQAAILACGAVKKQPVVNADGELAVGTRMKVTMSCDHRAVDGATGSEFLLEVKRLLESPVLLLV
jgi:pyruvate dehydrogenase E2 component (dihydrolipoamide acetyltransferase)